MKNTLSTVLFAGTLSLVASSFAQAQTASELQTALLALTPAQQMMGGQALQELLPRMHYVRVVIGQDGSRTEIPVLRFDPEDSTIRQINRHCFTGAANLIRQGQIQDSNYAVRWTVECMREDLANPAANLPNVRLHLDSE